MKTYKKTDKLMEQAKNGTFPKDFDQWDLADKNGWTVAHQAAQSHLSEDFNN